MKAKIFCLGLAILAGACGRAPKPLWRVALGGPHEGPAAAGSKLVYVATGPGLLAMDQASGNNAWSWSASSGTVGQLLALEGDRIAFNGPSARSLDLAGKELWAAAEGERLLGGDEKRMLLFNGKEILLRDAAGQEQAKVALEKGQTLNRSLVEGERFYLALWREKPKDLGDASFQPGLLRAYDFSGRLLWEAGQALGSYQESFSAAGHFFSSATGQGQGELGAFAWEGGRNAWSRRFQAAAVETLKSRKLATGGIVPMDRMILKAAAETEGVLAIALSTADGDKFMGLDAATGKELFEIKATFWGVWERGGAALTAPQGWQGRFYAGAGRYLACFDSRGKLLWRFKNEAPVRSAPVLSRGLAFCLDSKNNLSAFKISAD